MNTRHAAVITRREMYETLTDWRVILPVSALTFLLPLILAPAAAFVVNFIADERTAEALIPFSLLIVGFIPASFSIVTALESFVGERERNTLESLLSMPLSDRDLYVGKLSASLMTPLLSSYIAMLMFTFLMYILFPHLYFLSFTGNRLLALFVLVGLLTVAMVASAVVISSHISTIRASSLMSSFILLPAVLIVQSVAMLIIAARWDVLWIIAICLAFVVLVLVRTGIIAFNREEILSREHQPLALARLIASWQQVLHRNRPSSARSIPSHVRIQPVVAQIIPPLRAVPAIMRRELHETLTDWRMLVPVFMLSVLLPVVLLAATPYAQRFVQEDTQVARLVPFAILVVGFIPASFSLITALDSFVGERERSSLEALLALPMSDRTLYIGKLCSALVVPLATSYGAMLLFAAGFAQFYPDLYVINTSPARLTQLFAMIGMISVAMVAGAIIISSHTGSIRAANLLASFVLIPVTAIIAIQFPLIVAGRWDLVWWLVLGLVVATIALIRTGLRTFNREEILSRENEQLSIKRTVEHFKLCFREYHPAGVALNAYTGAPFSARRFYHHELLPLLIELRWPLLLALIAGVSGALLGGHLYETRQLTGAAETLRLVRAGHSEAPGPMLALTVLVQNVRVSILSTGFSLFSFGVFAFLVPAVAFAQIGFITTALRDSGGSWLALGASSPLQFVLAYILPHGIIELPTFLLSAALGIRLGAALLTPPGDFSVGDNIIWSLGNIVKVWLLVLLPLIVLASLVEGFVSPLVIQALYR